MTERKTDRPSEQDLRLARQLDRSMDTADSAREEPGPGQDPLLPFLMSYKSASQLATQTQANESLWPAMEAAIKQVDAARAEVSTLASSAESSATIADRAAVADQKGTVPRPWREQPGSQRAEDPPRMKVRWMPLLARVAALFMLVFFLWMLLFRQQSPEVQIALRTAAEKQQVALPDGSLVTLRPHSALYHLSDNDSGQWYRIEGEGYFEVTSNPQRQFVVMTDDAMVTVTGTRFSVGTWDRHTRVYLEQGAVLMSLADGSSVTALSPGETGRVDNGSIATAGGIPASTFLGWLEDELVLDRRPLSSITREIGHHFNVSISVSSDLVDAELSGTLVLDDAESILRDLALSIGASVEQAGPGQFNLVPTGQN
jgi:transmembrane sensor